MESVGLSELDLRLLHALQIHPRAPWTVVGDVLGVSAPTVARRWTRIHEAGLAWVTAYHPQLLGGVGDPVSAYVAAECAPGTAAAAAEALAAHPETLSVELTAGACELFVTVGAADRTALADYLLGPFGQVPGLLRTRTSWVTRLWLEGSRWRLRTLDRASARALRDAAGGVQRTRTATPPARDPVDEQLIALLAEDGRTPYARLAQECGIGEATARRRLAALLRSGRLALRCDVAWEAAGWPVTATLWARVPADRLEETARALTTLPEARLVATCVGEADLVLGLWLPALAEVHRVAAHLNRRFPGLEPVRWLTGLRGIKRVGRLLDADGRATGWVPRAD
ncbi:Lrp/AsnC family transcriptional regulator [Streptomyces iconiensis]|uniref:Lrp/AsnC family transcriptional regulator n=1 Tax=Streptomyces iconiensis TaxID=1384038 RepID=A0ABT6ZX19_9ACTN|nr:Lrp/AsnC family transcriptional regulator [Streptomyces iconiensis]MDJ1133604.1 Lrp/AsnC family transcriptional regulator [Streptomyces iconiensis]